MLVDEVIITVKGGRGGDGAISFKRNAQTAKGGPDGGNGGNGGNVYFTGINDITALSQFAYSKVISAENGVSGGKQNLYGRNGNDKLLKVPLGTVITDISEGGNYEINKLTEKLLIAKGGKGGRGNNEFKSSTVQAPRYRELGQLGEEKKIKLELKMIADIGLIGLPNAGKSSLLKALTNANPKIGDYPFTTLEPNLGVLNGKVIADIPGVIEGASNGKGLGDKFLRHIERTKLLVHCIDSGTNDVIKDYRTIRSELKNFNNNLLEKDELVVLTKTDLSVNKDLGDKLKKIKKLNLDCMLVSIINDESIRNLASKLLEKP